MILRNFLAGQEGFPFLVILRKSPKISRDFEKLSCGREKFSFRPNFSLVSIILSRSNQL